MLLNLACATRYDAWLLIPLLWPRPVDPEKKPADDTLRPGYRHDLLGRSPREFHWWNPKLDSQYTFNPDHQNAQLNFLGDYFGFIFDGSKLRIAWSDPRNGSESQVFYAGGIP